MRCLALLSVNAEFHSEIMWIWDLVSGHNPRAKWTKSVDAFAEAEYSRLHLTTLNIPCGDVVEDHIPPDIIHGIFGGEVLAGFLEHDSQLELVIEFLRE